jgi:hypothetical protein
MSPHPHPSPTHPARAEDAELPERRERLWLIVASPTVWAAHFLLAYVTAAVWCARVADPATFAPVRVAIAAYTVAALLAITWIGWVGWRRHRFADGRIPHDFDAPEGRHRFLGLATLLLSGLSAIAVVYAALAPVFIGSCV